MARAFVRANTKYATVTPAPPDRLTTVSLGLWFKTRSDVADFSAQELLAKGSGASNTGKNYGFQIYNFFGDGILVHWNQAAAEATWALHNFSVQIGRWYSLSASIDWSTNPDTVRLYLNGAAVGSLTGGGTNEGPTLSGTQTVRIGVTSEAGNAFDGDIAEAWVSPVFLPPGYHQGFANGSNPLAWGIPLDLYVPLYGRNTPEPDLSGAGRMAVLTNTPVGVAHPPVFEPLPRPRYWVAPAAVAAVLPPGLGPDVGMGQHHMAMPGVY